MRSRGNAHATTHNSRFAENQFNVTAIVRHVVGLCRSPVHPLRGLLNPNRGLLSTSVRDKCQKVVTAKAILTDVGTDAAKTPKAYRSSTAEILVRTPCWMVTGLDHER